MYFSLFFFSSFFSCFAAAIFLTFLWFKYHYHRRRRRWRCSSLLCFILFLPLAAVTCFHVAFVSCVLFHYRNNFIKFFHIRHVKIKLNRLEWITLLWVFIAMDFSTWYGIFMWDSNAWHVVKCLDRIDSETKGCVCERVIFFSRRHPTTTSIAHRSRHFAMNLFSYHGSLLVRTKEKTKRVWVYKSLSLFNFVSHALNRKQVVGKHCQFIWCLLSYVNNSIHN